MGMDYADERSIGCALVLPSVGRVLELGRLYRLGLVNSCDWPKPNKTESVIGPRSTEQHRS